MRSMCLTFLLAGGSLVVPSIASAQDPAGMPWSYLPQNGGAGIRTGNITSTGATVPKPGLSQSGGDTRLDKTIQRQNNKIDDGICKGC